MIRNTKKKLAQIKNNLFGFSYSFSDGREAYYFVLLSNAIKETLLRAKLKQDIAFNISEYGRVVASGYGSPSEEVRIFLHEKYNAEINA